MRRDGRRRQRVVRSVGEWRLGRGGEGEAARARWRGRGGEGVREEEPEVPRRLFLLLVSVPLAVPSISVQLRHVRRLERKREMPGSERVRDSADERDRADEEKGNVRRFLIAHERSRALHLVPVRHVMLVQACETVHVVLVERKVEDAGVVGDALLLGRLGDDDEALRSPNVVSMLLQRLERVEGDAPDRARSE